MSKNRSVVIAPNLNNCIAVSKEKFFTDEQKEIFEKFYDCWDECVSLA